MCDSIDSIVLVAIFLSIYLSISTFLILSEIYSEEIESLKIDFINIFINIKKNFIGLLTVFFKKILESIKLQIIKLINVMTQLINFIILCCKKSSLFLGIVILFKYGSLLFPHIIFLLFAVLMMLSFLVAFILRLF